MTFASVKMTLSTSPSGSKKKKKGLKKFGTVALISTSKTSIDKEKEVLNTEGDIKEGETP